ncbi:MAG TPA: hemerythrin domain-containing protein [Thermoanaerobaculia bacterium]|jgi:hemerythrin superfamily protein|nr:hemerythrin domain-containing protein [Thermoanaerobaculia bacterium]
MATKKSSKSAKKGPDAIALLKEDHKKVKGLFADLEKSSMRGGPRAQKLVAQIDKELTIHTTIEEEIFYPAFRDAVRSKDDKKMYFEAKEEHHVVKLVLPEVKEGGMAVEEFAAKCKVLKELVEHHADEEEKEMFPEARKVLSRPELQELGDRMAARKKELGA